MSNRITSRDIDTAFDRWLTTTGHRHADSYNDVGAFRIGGAYGRVRLEKIVSEGGGINDVTGYLTKRELYEWFAAGIATAQLSR